jgi:hypothetical protein
MPPITSSKDDGSAPRRGAAADPLAKGVRVTEQCTHKRRGDQHHSGRAGNITSAEGPLPHFG